MFPILFEIGPFTLHSLWFFIALGFLVSSLMVSRAVKRNRMRLDFLSKHSFLFFISAIISSRLLFIIFHTEIFFADSDTFLQEFFAIFRVWDKGLSFWGAALGFSIAFLYLAKRERENIFRWMDITAVPLLTALLFGHFGAFLDGINHGRETILPWGITFESAVVKYTVPVHPTQLYALLYTAVILIFISSAKAEWHSKHEGLLAKVAIFLYASFRFLEDFFRGDDTLMLFDFIRISQIISFGIALYMGYRLLKEYSLRLFHL